MLSSVSCPGTHPVPDPAFEFVPTFTGLARIVPTMESDVLLVTPNKFTTALFGTFAWKCALIFSAEPSKSTRLQSPKHLLTSRRSGASRMTLREGEVLACFLLDDLPSLTPYTKLSGLPSSYQDCLASSFLVTRPCSGPRWITLCLWLLPQGPRLLGACQALLSIIHGRSGPSNNTFYNFVQSTFNFS